MFDSHTHTQTFSPDAKQSLDTLVEEAVETGLEGIAVTEHMDPDLEIGQMVFDLDAYFAKMTAARQRMRNGFRLLYGMEAGYQPHLVSEYKRMASQYPFDLVIGSVHAMDGEDIYFKRDVFEKGRDHAYGAYIELLSDMVRDGSWLDVVGHFDYVSRVSGYPSPKIEYSAHADHFDTLFRCMVQNGKSLEINGRTIRFFQRQGLTDPFPDRDIFTRYRELGGEMVTIGSDSHNTDEVGYLFAELGDYLKNIGYKRVFTFIERQPVPIGL